MKADDRADTLVWPRLFWKDRNTSGVPVWFARQQGHRMAWITFRVDAS